MHKIRISALAASVSVVTFLGGCSDNPTKVATPEPAAIDTLAGSAEKTVTLTKDAAERISVSTGTIATGGGAETIVPYGAVIYDAEGLAWAYVSKAENVFIREALGIIRIEGDRAYLSSGPAVGTKVAVVGVAELYGAETGIGK
jgi:hypothetical protein